MLNPLRRQFPRPFVAAFLLLGSIGSLLLGHELAVVDRLGRAPTVAQPSQPDSPTAAWSPWIPVLVSGDVGAIPSLPHSHGGAPRSAGATASSSHLSPASFSAQPPRALGREGNRERGKGKGNAHEWKSDMWTADGCRSSSPVISAALRMCSSLKLAPGRPYRSEYGPSNTRLTPARPL